MPFYVVDCFFPTFALEINQQIPNIRKNRKLTHRDIHRADALILLMEILVKFAVRIRFAKVLARGEDCFLLIYCTVYQSLH